MIRRTSGSAGPAAEITGLSWVRTPEELQTLIDELLGEEAYAIDTEFLRERTYYPQLALVQIGWGDKVAIVDPLAVDIGPLRQLLESDVLAVFHAADQDLEVLDLACGAIPRRLFDTQLAAGFVGFSTPSLSTLVERLVGVKLSKGDRLTDWMKRPLTEAQVRYAASDVVHLLEIRRLLNAELEASGRTSWVAEESEILRTRTRGQNDPQTSWWRLKDGRVLRGRDRLIAQELCAWRERRAQHEDRPVRFILPDLAVLAIAQGHPKSTGDLVALRGMDGRYAKSPGGNELIEVVATAMAGSMDSLRLPESDDFDRKLRPALTLVSAWVGQLSHDVRVEASLLATRSDLISFLRNEPGSRLASGWRNEVLGNRVRQVISGEAALAFDRDHGLVLEHRSGNELAVTIAVPTAVWETEAPDHRLDGY
jgi:ribonuclease D